MFAQQKGQNYSPFRKLSDGFQVFLDYKSIHLSVGANRSRWFDLLGFFILFLPVSLFDVFTPLFILLYFNATMTLKTILFYPKLQFGEHKHY